MTTEAPEKKTGKRPASLDAPPEVPPAPDPTPTPDPVEEKEKDERQVSEDAAAPESDDQEPSAEEVLDIIIPGAEQRTWQVGELQFTQKPLSYVRKMQFFSLLARAMRVAMDAGGVGVLQDLFGGGFVNRASQLSQSDFDDAGEFMRIVFALVEFSPDLILDAQCIWLSVPPAQQPYVKAAWAGDVEGVNEMTDEEGKEMIQIFIVQNWDAITSFFTEHVRDIITTARRQQKESKKNQQ